MNILPTSPDRTLSSGAIETYFEDLKRWNFDVAYSAFYAFSHENLIGKYKEAYTRFAERARQEGLPSCVQIQSTVGYLDSPDLLEGGQYHLDNTPIVYEHHHGEGPKNFFGSYASDIWFNYITDVTRILKGYGFDWVVFEEPMYRVDIPGTKDAFHDLFKERFPDLPYPTRRDESESYLRLQQLKMDVLEDFYRRCCSQAKQMGYTQVGIMPWFFSPTYENTPAESWTTCCDTGKITFLEDLDFVIVRMQPDNVWAEAMVASGGESLPRLAYLENLAHGLGKPTIAVNNPTNEHVTLSQMGGKDLLDYEYFARFTLSALAAAPSGMSRHWYGKNYDQDSRHMDLYETCNPFFGRLGGPKSPIAMVFSYRSTSRVMPRPWLEIWKGFYSIAQAMLFDYKMPCLTFFADTLAESLDRHPEVDTLVLSSYFPISEQETEFLQSWLSEKTGRNVIYLGADFGYTYDPGNRVYQWDTRSGPEMLTLFGLDPKTLQPYRRDDRFTLQAVNLEANNLLYNFKQVTVRTSGIAKVQFLDEDVETLYHDKKTKLPVITRRKVGEGNYAYWIGLSLDGIEPGPVCSEGCFPFPLANLLSALHRDSEYPIVVNATGGVLWNETRAGFLILCNTWEETAKVELKEIQSNYWDCRKEAWLTGSSLKIAPLDFAVLRIVPQGSPLLDLLNISAVTRIQESHQAFDIQGLFSKNFCLISTCPPEAISFNDEPIDWDMESIELGWGILPVLTQPAEGLLKVKWSEARLDAPSARGNDL